MEHRLELADQPEDLAEEFAKWKIRRPATIGHDKLVGRFPADHQILTIELVGVLLKYSQILSKEILNIVVRFILLFPQGAATNAHDVDMVDNELCCCIHVYTMNRKSCLAQGLFWGRAYFGPENLKDPNIPESGFAPDGKTKLGQWKLHQGHGILIAAIMALQAVVDLKARTNSDNITKIILDCDHTIVKSAFGACLKDNSEKLERLGKAVDSEKLER